MDGLGISSQPAPRPSDEASDTDSPLRERYWPSRLYCSGHLVGEANALEVEAGPENLPMEIHHTGLRYRPAPPEEGP
jgi:hypothetical protein